MGDVPEQVFIDAAMARTRATFGDETDEMHDGITAYAHAVLEGRDFRAAVASAYRAGQAATPNGPRTWAPPDDAEVEEQWGSRMTWPDGDVETWLDTRTVVENRVRWHQEGNSRSGVTAELVRREVITMPWEPADATPAADGQDGRDG